VSQVQENDVSGVPTLILEYRGALRVKFQGDRSKSNILKWVNKITNNTLKL
jgi:hypothetical protein